MTIENTIGMEITRSIGTALNGQPETRIAPLASCRANPLPRKPLHQVRTAEFPAISQSLFKTLIRVN
tara:strand:+ start:21147 stop:21347 length:201 start_codon:yes stop_codon:yes gene_type:complete